MGLYLKKHNFEKRIYECYFSFLILFILNLITNSLNRSLAYPLGHPPLSPILANLLIQDLKMSILSNINVNIPINYRYVDDNILIALPKNLMYSIFKMFNSYHKRLNFTIEHIDDNSIYFLDVKLENGHIKFDIFKKSTSGRSLSYKFNHPIIHKKGAIG